MPYDTEDQDAIAERGAIIAEIMLLSYWVNCSTEYCVFADFSGHVDLFSIEIAESKDRYNERIASTSFYTNYSGEPLRKITPLDSLLAKRDHLKRHTRQRRNRPRWDGCVERSY